MTLVPVSDRPFIRRTAEPILEIGPRTLEEMQAAYKESRRRLNEPGLCLIAELRAELAQAKAETQRLKQEAEQRARAEKEAWDKAAQEARAKLAAERAGVVASPKIRAIIRVVAAHYGVTPLAIVSHCRFVKFSFPRQVAMYLARYLTPLSWPAIAMNFGGRDHSTIIHGVNKITRLIEADPVLAATIQMLREDLELEAAKSCHIPACGAHSAEQPTPDMSSGSEAKS